MNSAVTSACNEITRRYRSAGFSIEVAHEQAGQFGQRFIRIGDHTPELVRTHAQTIMSSKPAIDATPRGENDLDATLDLVGP